MQARDVPFGGAGKTMRGNLPKEADMLAGKRRDRQDYDGEPSEASGHVRQANGASQRIANVGQAKARSNK